MGRVKFPAFWRVLLKVLVNGLYPALMLAKVTGGYDKTSLLDHWYLPVASFCLMLAGFVFFHAYAMLFGHKIPPARKATMGVLATAGNYVFLPYPLALTLWGEAAGQDVLLATLGSDLGLWTLAVSFFGGSVSQRFRGLITPPLIALASAVTLVYLERPFGSAWEFLLTPLGMIGQLAVPVAMLILGHHLAQIKWRKVNLKDHAAVIAIRLLLIPTSALVLWHYVELPQESGKVIFLIATMPAAVASVFLARLYKGDPNYAAQAIALTHAIALVTVPIWIYCAI